VWWPQGFVQDEDIAIKKAVAEYEKVGGNKIDVSITPFAPQRQKRRVYPPRLEEIVERVPRLRRAVPLSLSCRGLARGRRRQPAPLHDTSGVLPIAVTFPSLTTIILVSSEKQTRGRQPSWSIAGECSGGDNAE
jgi:hypothetical protein